MEVWDMKRSDLTKLKQEQTRLDIAEILRLNSEYEKLGLGGICLSTGPETARKFLSRIKNNQWLLMACLAVREKGIAIMLGSKCMKISSTCLIICEEDEDGVIFNFLGNAIARCKRVKKWRKK